MSGGGGAVWTGLSGGEVEQIMGGGPELEHSGVTATGMTWAQFPMRGSLARNRAISAVWVSLSALAPRASLRPLAGRSSLGALCESKHDRSNIHIVGTCDSETPYANSKCANGSSGDGCTECKLHDRGVIDIG